MDDLIDPGVSEVLGAVDCPVSGDVVPSSCSDSTDGSTYFGFLITPPCSSCDTSRVLICWALGVDDWNQDERSNSQDYELQKVGVGVGWQKGE